MAGNSPAGPPTIAVAIVIIIDITLALAIAIDKEWYIKQRMSCDNKLKS